MKSDAITRIRLGSLLILIMLCQAAAAEAPDPAESSSTFALELKYQELPYSFLNWGVNLVTQSENFSREPETAAGAALVRGTFRFGTGSDQEIPFFWDATAGTLRLDLNRNGDVTDDPAGVYSTTDSRYSRFSQSFNEIRLELETPSGVHRVFFDLHLRNYDDRPGAYAALRSFWQGKLELDGRHWQVGLAQNLTDQIGKPGNGYLLLRPWDSNEKPFLLEAGPLDGFALTRHLFFQDRGFQLDFKYEPGGQAPHYTMELQPLQPELGELDIAGTSIKRLVLVSPPYTVVLDAPGAKARIPTGRYEQCHVLVGSQEKEAHPELYGRTRGFDPITVSAGKAALLKTGGPLTNSVLVSQRGKQLILNYQLLGADGRTYQVRNQDHSKPPRFAVYQDGKQIHSGQFEFG
jgi:hypothetical protein